MATWNERSNTSAVLDSAERWKLECLLQDGSIFSSDTLWTEENLTALCAVFLENPIHGSGSFIDKLEKQVSAGTPAVQKLGAEALWVLFLFVSDKQMGPTVKRERFARIWSISSGDLPDSQLLNDQVLSGIGRPGPAFMTKIPDELGYLLTVMKALKRLSLERRGELLSKPWLFGDWLDQQSGSDRRAFRHMLLFFCFPETYERISSGRHKRKIRETFADKLPPEEQKNDDRSMLATDQVLLLIRNSLSEAFGTTKLDFYLAPIRALWLESEASEDIEQADEGEIRRYWIEKTLVSGRPDREKGEHALGQALWSPQKSKSGGDIYANMRKIKEGDVVFHLTDNESISGVSVAAAHVDNGFTGLAGTEWEGPAYRVPLSKYQPLDPPLPRAAFLETQPFATELRELAHSGVKGLFFNSRGALNQGAYITEASPTVLSILNRAYQAYCGEVLPYVPISSGSESEGALRARGYTIDDALEDLFLDRQEVEDILLLWAAKKNIILQGPPGVGKSFAAQKLAFALVGAEDRERVGFVQFHQSYSYEDFVEGFRPSESGFELRAGKFVEFCRRAEADQHRSYVFIIDEINRGNLSKILGELMLLIESDKRDAKWAMPLASGRLPFYVPANVNILGLMNTADRSLAVVDYALRRRFAFIDLKPKLESPKFRSQLEQAGVQSSLLDSLIGRIDALNQEIATDVINLGPGFVVGHSFFCAGPNDSEDGPSWYARVIRTEIGPLLREYWFDQPTKAKGWEDQLLAPL